MVPRTIAAVLLAAAAVPASAQLSDDLAGYFDGPAGFLLTARERSAWEEVRSDESAHRFLELFWARRDPDLATWVNEFKCEFELRVALADQLYGYGSTRGAVSDRGRALILLGPFDAQYDKPRGSETGDQRFQRSGGLLATGGAQTGNMVVYSERPAVELWEYSGGRFPGLTRQDSFYVIFVETQAGQKDFVLDREHRKNATAVRALGDAPDRLLLHPELPEAPRVGMVPGSRPISEQETGWLEGPVQPWPEGAAVAVRQGVVASAPLLAWVHLGVPEQAAAPRTLVGRFTDAGTGRLLGSFSLPVSPLPLDGMLMVNQAVPVEAGRWYLELALAGESGPIAVTATIVVADPVAPQDTVFAPMIWGPRRVDRASAPLGTAFVVGGWLVPPRPGDVYGRDETLHYLGFVLRPALGDGGSPRVSSSLALLAGGRELVRTPEREIALTRVGEGLWMVGGELPLEMLTQPGRYTLEVVLRQEVDGLEHVERIPVTIRPPG